MRGHCRWIRRHSSQSGVLRYTSELGQDGEERPDDWLSRRFTWALAPLTVADEIERVWNCLERGTLRYPFHESR